MCKSRECFLRLAVSTFTFRGRKWRGRRKGHLLQFSLPRHFICILIHIQSQLGALGVAGCQDGPRRRPLGRYQSSHLLLSGDSSRGPTRCRSHASRFHQLIDSIISPVDHVSCPNKLVWPTEVGSVSRESRKAAPVHLQFKKAFFSFNLMSAS